MGILRGITVAICAIMVMPFAMSSEGWGRSPMAGVVGIAHIGLAVVLAVRTDRDSPAQWLGLALALLGTNVLKFFVATYELFPNGPFWIADRAMVAGSAIAVSSFHIFAMRLGRPPEGERLPGLPVTRILDRGSLPFAIVFFVLFLSLGATTPFLSSGATTLLLAWVLVVGARAVYHLFSNFHRAERAERLRIKWVLLAALFWFTAPIIGLSFEWLHLVGFNLNPGPVGQVALVSIPLSGSFVLVFGTVAKNAVDPSLALRRSALLTILATILVFGFGALEAAFSDALLAQLGLQAGAGLWITAGTLAVALRPLERVTRPRIDRVFAKWELGAGED